MNRYMMANGMDMGQAQDAMGMGIPMHMPTRGDPNGMMGFGAPDMAGGWNGMWTQAEANPHAGQGMVDAMKRGAGV